MVGVASLFSWIMTVENVSTMLTNFVTSAGVNRNLFLLFAIVVYLILGMLIDGTPIILLTAPIFAPIAKILGIDLVHFGIVTIVAVAYGMFTPPFGTCVFMANTYSKQPVMGN